VAHTHQLGFSFAAQNLSQGLRYQVLTETSSETDRVQQLPDVCDCVCDGNRLRYLDQEVMVLRAPRPRPGIRSGS
jgi:hypothetical protein